jgi:hypothetical protein
MTCNNQEIGKLIGSYELSLLSKKERRSFENHLLHCEYCFQSLYQTAPIAKLMREGKLAPTGDIELIDEEEKEIPSEPSADGGIPRFLRRPWVYAAGAISLVVIALMVVQIMGPRKKTELLRGQDEVSILVLSPVGEVTVASELKWKAIKGVPAYEVRILTADGDLVWEGSVRGTTAVLPDSIGEAITPGQTYFWQVEAQTAEEDLLKSAMIRFKIRK